MSSSATNPYCKDRRYNCFAKDEQHCCKCLNNTDFAKHDCPFYKTREDYEFGLIIRPIARR